MSSTNKRVQGAITLRQLLDSHTEGNRSCLGLFKYGTKILPKCSSEYEISTISFKNALDDLSSILDSNEHAQDVGLINKLEWIAFAFCCPRHQKKSHSIIGFTYYWLAIERLPGLLSCARIAIEMKGDEMIFYKIKSDVSCENEVCRERCHCLHREIENLGQDEKWLLRQISQDMLRSFEDRDGFRRNCLRTFMHALDFSSTSSSIHETEDRKLEEAKLLWDSWYLMPSCKTAKADKAQDPDESEPNDDWKIGDVTKKSFSVDPGQNETRRDSPFGRGSPEQKSMDYCLTFSVSFEPDTYQSPVLNKACSPSTSPGDSPQCAESDIDISSTRDEAISEPDTPFSVSSPLTYRADPSYKPASTTTIESGTDYTVVPSSESGSDGINEYDDDELLSTDLEFQPGSSGVDDFHGNSSGVADLYSNSDRDNGNPSDNNHLSSEDSISDSDSKVFNGPNSNQLLSGNSAFDTRRMSINGSDCNHLPSRDPASNSISQIINKPDGNHLSSRGPTSGFHLTGVAKNDDDTLISRDLASKPSFDSTCESNGNDRLTGDLPSVSRFETVNESDNDHLPSRDTTFDSNFQTINKPDGSNLSPEDPATGLDFERFNELDKDSLSSRESVSEPGTEDICGPDVNALPIGVPASGSGSARVDEPNNNRPLPAFVASDGGSEEINELDINHLPLGYLALDSGSANIDEPDNTGLTLPAVSAGPCRSGRFTVPAETSVPLPAQHVANASRPSFRPFQKVKKTVEQLRQNILKLMQEDVSGEALNQGYIYIFRSPDLRGLVKIGMTRASIEARQSSIRKCLSTTVEPFDIKTFSLVQNYSRVERLVHLELWNQRRCFDCSSPHGSKVKKSTVHDEWFEISEAEATQVVGRWRKWTSTRPYSGGLLSMMEKRRIRRFSEDDQFLNMVFKDISNDEWSWNDFMTFPAWKLYLLQIYYWFSDERGDPFKNSRFASLRDHWKSNLIILLAFFDCSLVVFALPQLLPTTLASAIMLSFINSAILGTCTLLYAA